MKQFIRLFLWAMIPLAVWFTRHQTVYPQAFSKTQVDGQLPTLFFLQTGDYDDSDRVWAEMFLRDSIHLNMAGSTEEKIEQLGRYLIDALHTNMHESSSELMQMSPREQFNQIRYHHASFYCSNYVAIYGFFARVAGLAVRDIELKSDTRWHIVSETWSKELNRWWLTDLTHQAPLLRTPSGTPMSLFEAQTQQQLPRTMQADYAAETNLYLHVKNDALQLQSVQTKWQALLLSKAYIVPIKNEGRALWWPIAIKYLAFGGWIFLSFRILRGRA